ncbi:hypothetical protein FFLO_05339 [Filobasidium floriforme]|uniref:Integrase catalytic domain-containing protein n=1 Tax=Filobasidium floriforme TaxID=5210 RepID=A0A8K0NP19_9TREE|nr:hypothetical protein FFLO_05339 [Filobasidium floriforme]
MFNSLSIFEYSPNFRECRLPVRVGDNRVIWASGIGDVTLQTGERTTIDIPKCLYVPALHCNLISISQLDREGYHSQFGNGTVAIRKHGQPILSGQLENNLYTFDLKPINIESAQLAVTEDLWHKRLGHYPVRKLTALSNAVKGISLDRIKKTLVQTCEACVQGKATRASFPLRNTTGREVLEVLSIDLAGPSHEESIGGGRYFLIIKDHASDYFSVHILKRKNDAFDKFKGFLLESETQTGKKCKVVRSDNGGEFINATWKEFLSSRGVIHETTTPYTPEQNGGAERAVRTVKEGARTSLIESGLSNRYWSAAVEHFVFTRNRTLVKQNDKTPFERFFGRVPDVSHLRVFGCVAYVLIPKEKRTSGWSPKAIKSVFIGYGEDKEKKRAWITYDPYKREKTTSCHVTFWEDQRWKSTGRVTEDIFPREVDATADVDVFYDARENPEREPEDQPAGAGEGRPEERIGPDDELGPPDLPRDVPEPEQPDIPLALRRIPRERRIPERYKDYVRCAIDGHGPESQEIVDAAFLAAGELNPNDPKFDKAKDDELRSMEANQVWTLVPPSKGRKPIGCRWVCTDKQIGPNETKPKARLVAQGYTQISGIDYNEIFSPVVKLESVRYILATAAALDLELIQADVKTAFLYGVLEEKEVYMRQPPGRLEPGKEDWWCLLRKAIYGLHQSPRVFYKHIRDVLRGIDLHPIKSDYSVFGSRDPKNGITLLGLYVDDGILACSSLERQGEVRAYLSSHFQMTWTENPRMLLGLEIDRKREEGIIRISQRQLAQSILNEFDMNGCAATNAPMTGMIENTLDDQSGHTRPTPDTSIPYLVFIGKANYLARGTRPDLSFAVSHLASFCAVYQADHWTACKHVMRYLKGSLNASITYKRTTTPNIVGYSDASWANLTDRKSMGGYIFTMAGGPISWNAKKQAIVARSSTEAEYIALDSTLREAIWWRSFTTELGMGSDEPTLLYEDNQACIKLAQNPIAHARSKHIDVKYHAIREAVESKAVTLQYLSTSDMVADCMTKPLNGPQIKHLASRMGLELV